MLAVGIIDSERFFDEMFDLGILDQRDTWRRPLLRTLLMDGVLWAALTALESRQPFYREGPRVIGSPHRQKIAIIHSARVPFALRPRLNGKFSVVGQCHYDGAVYGGILDPDDDSADIFTLV